MVVQLLSAEEQEGIKLPDLVQVAWPEGTDSHTALDPEFQDDSRDITGEVAGNIHREEYDDFWSSQLQPDLWTARVRAEGHKLSFIGDQWPEEYHERNNKSVAEDPEFTWQQLTDWERKGVVLRSATKPHCVSPLSVSSREVMQEVKKRLCLDLSRHINKLIKQEQVKLSGLDKALDILLPGDWQATYDLVSAYHHIRIHPDHRTLLRCCVPNPDSGEDIYFVFACMPFGLSTATHVLTRMTKPICVFATRNGIRHLIFIDDGKVNGENKAALL